MVLLVTKHIVSDHPEKIRMLVLETDEIHLTTQKEHGGFGEILDTFFEKAGDDHDSTLGIKTVIQYIVEDDGGVIPKFKEIGDDIYATLITGSVYDAHGIMSGSSS